MSMGTPGPGVHISPREPSRLREESAISQSSSSGSPESILSRGVTTTGEGNREEVVLLRTDLPIMERGSSSSPRSGLYADGVNTSAVVSVTQPTAEQLRTMTFTQWLQW